MVLSDFIYSLSNSGCFRRINITDVYIGFGPGLNISFIAKSVLLYHASLFPFPIYTSVKIEK